jgi:hypothetical protein
MAVVRVHCVFRVYGLVHALSMSMPIRYQLQKSLEMRQNYHKRLLHGDSTLFNSGHKDYAVVDRSVKYLAISMHTIKSSNAR